LAVVVPFENPSPPSIARLIGFLAADMERVNAVILSRTGSDVAMIPEVANHLIASGGKRLRPMLEFMHTATLLHDDVVDESEMRRGKLAARLLWGNEASVLVGDFLLGQAFKMMVEVGSLRSLEILSSAAAVIAEGEVMQLAAAKNTATTEDEYLFVIRAKTAELFAAACEVGPALGARPKDEQSACRSFGMNLGIAFQLVDDALDYGGKAAKLGKNVGDDFREGKITLPRSRDRVDGQAPRDRGHRPARPPLWRHRQGCAGAVPGLTYEGSAGRDGGVLHRAVELAKRYQSVGAG